MWVLDDSFNKWLILHYNWGLPILHKSIEYEDVKQAVFFPSMLKSHPSWDGPLSSLKPLFRLGFSPLSPCLICFTQLMKGLGPRLEFWIWVGVFPSFLFLGVISALDVDPLFVFFPLVSWHCLSFGCWFTLCFPPFCFWVLSHLWMLVLSLYSLLLFWGVVLVFGCWSSLCVPRFCF